MKTQLYLITILTWCLCNPILAQDNFELPLTAGMEGFGFGTKGGRGGEIVKVTNLNKSGVGSFKAAVEMEGPRIVVFEAGGVIDLESSVIMIENPNITIAGQTAPDPGITLIKGGISITTHEVIIQHISVRPGEAGHKKKSGWEADGITTSQGAFNVIIDHCSATWATDENISASGPRFEGETPEEWRENTSHKVLISNCIIAEGLSHSTHSKGEHSKGSLIHDNTSEIAVIGNLYASNVRRNPFFKGGSEGIIVNNYVYNPGEAFVHYNLSPKEWNGHEWITGKMTVIGNVFEFGKDTPKSTPTGKFRGPVEVFWKDNEVISGKEKLAGSHSLVEKEPVWPSGFSPAKTEKVKEQVLNNAGSRPWSRNNIDQRIIDQIKNGTNRIINSEQDVGGYPQTEPVFQKFNPGEWDMDTMDKK